MWNHLSLFGSLAAKEDKKGKKAKCGNKKGLWTRFKGQFPFKDSDFVV